MLSAWSNIINGNSFDLNKAREIQSQITGSVKIEKCPPVKRIAGADAAYDIDKRVVVGAVVVTELPNLNIIDSAYAAENIAIPYIPGYLAFRELPAIIHALNKLNAAFDLLMCDGHGIAHPRRCGIATHLGVMLNIPSIGVAKKRLIGSQLKNISRKGDRAELEDHGEIVGAVVCTREGVKPVFVSVGNKITLNQAVEVVMQSVTRYRFPEPIRQAHILAGRQLRLHRKN